MVETIVCAVQVETLEDVKGMALGIQLFVKAARRLEQWQSMKENLDETPLPEGWNTSKTSGMNVKSLLSGSTASYCMLEKNKASS